MENHLRLILFIVGSIILAIVLWDVLRQRSLQKRQELQAEHDLIEDDSYASRQQSLDFGESAEDPWSNSKEFGESVGPAVMVTDKKHDFEVKFSEKTLVNSNEHTDQHAEAEEELVNPDSLQIIENEEIYPQTNTAQTTDNSQIFALYVMARDGKGFEGARLKRLLESSNLSYGKMNIFHKYTNNNSQEVLFSVASAMEPGSFNLHKINNQYIPGVTIFMLLRNTTDHRKAFDALVRMAKQLAFALNGELRDQNFQPLTLQYIENQKQNLKNYSARRR